MVKYVSGLTLFLGGLGCMLVGSLGLTSYAATLFVRGYGLINTQTFFPSWMMTMFLVGASLVVLGIVWQQMVNQPIRHYLRQFVHWGKYGGDPYLARALLVNQEEEEELQEPHRSIKS